MLASTTLLTKNFDFYLQSRTFFTWKCRVFVPNFKMSFGQFRPYSEFIQGNFQKPHFHLTNIRNSWCFFSNFFLKKSKLFGLREQFVSRGATETGISREGEGKESGTRIYDNSKQSLFTFLIHRIVRPHEIWLHGSYCSIWMYIWMYLCICINGALSIRCDYPSISYSVWFTTKIHFSRD